ncbi:MAG: hypothetical protein JNM20_15185 [Rhizobiales bacterium]|nr:hypothetical protein [Hyphomicrobiales bacterium]
MPVFCQLTTKKGVPVFVNPELVRFVAAGPDQGTLVNFSDGKGLVVDGDPKRVATMLSLARNASPPAKRPAPRAPRPQPS